MLNGIEVFLEDIISIQQLILKYHLINESNLCKSNLLFSLNAWKSK